jgi:hypothetical protein
MPVTEAKSAVALGKRTPFVVLTISSIVLLSRSDEMPIPILATDVEVPGVALTSFPVQAFFHFPLSKEINRQFAVLS